MGHRLEAPTAYAAERRSRVRRRKAERPSRPARASPIQRSECLQPHPLSPSLSRRLAGREGTLRKGSGEETEVVPRKVAQQPFRPQRRKGFLFASLPPPPPPPPRAGGG